MENALVTCRQIFMEDTKAYVYFEPEEVVVPKSLPDALPSTSTVPIEPVPKLFVVKLRFVFKQTARNFLIPFVKGGRNIIKRSGDLNFTCRHDVSPGTRIVHILFIDKPRADEFWAAYNCFAQMDLIDTESVMNDKFKNP